MPHRVNYIYFGCYFLILTLLSASGVFLKEPLNESRCFFLLYAMGQTALETTLFILIALLLENLSSRIYLLMFIGLTFAFFILHVLDFIVDRILDLSIWQTISAFVIDESWSNFVLLLEASGVAYWTWYLIFVSILLLPLLGIFLYQITEKITHCKALSLRLEPVTLMLFSVSSAILYWDVTGSKVIHPNTYTAFLQSLPWKSTFLQPKHITLQMASPLSPPPLESEVMQYLSTSKPQLEKKPNIYLFIIESFREDFINEEVSPHLHAFRQSAMPIQKTLSNANASHQSWFSIFHSQFSHQWQNVQKSDWEMGSPPLQFLKNLGYQVRLYSSADLGYYGMETLLFGKGGSLIDSYQKFPHAPPLSAADTDAQTIATLKKDLEENKNLHEGNVFIIFWDATHFDYSWPKNWAPKFIPFASEFAYFNAFYHQNQINLIKNRYRNAVNYVDSLFGQFLETVPNTEEAIIVVTGDHGEEFFEHGHLFHGSHLTFEQTQVPIFIKLGKSQYPKAQPIGTHIDIFPTLIDYLTGQNLPFLQGESLLLENKRPFAILSRFNAGRSPYEFGLFNGQYKMIGRFLNRKNILATEQIQIISLLDHQDRILKHSPDLLHNWIHQEFGAAMQALFPVIDNP